MKPLVSLVIPVYNEEESLPELAEHLDALMAATDYPIELVFVDDGSTDNSAAILLALREKDERYKLVRLARNFGNQVAFSAGMELATGAALVLVNADLQDPPELVLDLLAKWEEGYDVVYAVRRSRSEGLLHRLCFSAFYRLLNRVASVPMPLDAGCFGLMDRRVANVVLGSPERNRYLPGLRAYAGFRQTGIPYDRPPRFAGRSSGILSQVRFAIDAIFSFSRAPIHAILYGGALFVLVGIGCIAYDAVVASVLVVGGAILAALAVIGGYVVRIYDEVRRRPLYTVSELHGLSSGEHLGTASGLPSRAQA